MFYIDPCSLVASGQFRQLRINFVLKIGRGEAEGRGGGTPAARDGGEESVGGTAACSGTESRALPDSGNRAAGSREEGGRDKVTI